MMIRRAEKREASDLAILIDAASHGIASYVWQGLRNGEASLFEVGRKRAMREEGGFSYRNAQVLEADGCLAGMIIGYTLDDPYDVGDLNDTPEEFRPLIELEAVAPGSWYVNVLAVFEEHRGKGYGRKLLAKGEEIARAAGARELSIIVEDDNHVAFGLYQNVGYRERARRPVVPFPTRHLTSDEWVLLAKDIQS